MSKAFVKDDHFVDSPLFVPLDLTSGGNFLTIEGFKRLKNAVAAMETKLGDESRTHKAHLERVLRTATVIDPATQSGDRAVFGATVTVLNADEHEKTYSLVGVQEADPRSGKISWISPIGKALLGKSVGDVVTVQTPRGPEDLEISKIEFKTIA